MASRYNRQTSLGTLSRLHDDMLRRVFSFLQPSELMHDCARVSWLFFVLHNCDELWKALVLRYHVNTAIKQGTFTFKGSWKVTMLKPHAAVSEAGQKPLPVISNSLVINRRNAQIECVRREFIEKRAASAAANGTAASSAGSAEIGSGEKLPQVLIDMSSSINMPAGMSIPSYAFVRQKEDFLWYNLVGHDLLKWPMNLKGIDRRDKLSVPEFREQYEAKNLPVVLSGLIDDWPARQRWQLNNIAQEYGHVPMKCNGRSANGRRFRMTLFDYLSYTASINGEKPLYVFDKKVLYREDGAFSRDYAVPPHFSEDLFALMDEEERPDYKWLLIGPHGSATPFHQDPHRTSAWNAVLDGIKRVSFYPPDVIPPGVDEELIDTDYYASDDAMDWYRNTFPQLPEAQKPLECLVYPGDIIFIPSGWWHQVVNIGITVAVTQNYVSSYTFPMAADDMNGKGSKTLRKDFKCALAEADDPKWRVYADFIHVKKKNKNQTRNGDAVSQNGNNRSAATHR